MSRTTDQRPIPFAPLFGTIVSAVVAGGLGFVVAHLLDVSAHTLWRPLSCHTPLFLFFALGASLLAMKGHGRAARCVAAIPLAIVGFFCWSVVRMANASARGISDAEQYAEVHAFVLKQQLAAVGVSTFIALGLLGTTWWVTRGD